MDALATVTYAGTKKNLVESGMVADQPAINGQKVTVVLEFPRDIDPFLKSTVKAAEAAIKYHCASVFGMSVAEIPVEVEIQTEFKSKPRPEVGKLLFLRHPEGIAFKQLPDYREELTSIYAKLRPAGLTERAMQSIEDVTNPMLNSINEKCARIRAAFVGQFDDYMAKSYYVDGARGEAKKIALPRSLVVWE